MQTIPNNKYKNLRICAVSDIHGEYYNCKNLINQTGEILIIGGDFTYYGTDQDFDNFIDFLDALKGWKHKIVISGNHEIILDGGLNSEKKKLYFAEFPCKYSRQFILDELKKRAIYLEHQCIQLEGLKIFGSPYTTYYCGSAFQVESDLLKVYWDNIPENLDILITHGPPFGIYDRTAKKVNAGCKYLLDRIQKVKPKIHIFGHIHEGRAKFGQCIYREEFSTRFYNVALKPSVIQFKQYP